jgi:hypothetical protein
LEAKLKGYEVGSVRRAGAPRKKNNITTESGLGVVNVDAVVKELMITSFQGAELGSVQVLKDKGVNTDFARPVALVKVETPVAAEPVIVLTPIERLAVGEQMEISNPPRPPSARPPSTKTAGAAEDWRLRAETAEADLDEERNLVAALQDQLRRALANKKSGRPGTAPAAAESGWNEDLPESVESEEQVPYQIRAQWPQYAGRRQKLLYDDSRERHAIDVRHAPRRPARDANSAKTFKRLEGLQGLEDADDVEESDDIFETEILEALRRRRRPVSSFVQRFLRGREVVREREAEILGEDLETTEVRVVRRPQSCPPTLYHIRAGGWRLAIRPSSGDGSTTRPTTGSFSLVRGNRPQSRLRFLLREDL